MKNVTRFFGAPLRLHMGEKGEVGRQRVGSNAGSAMFRQILTVKRFRELDWKISTAADGPFKIMHVFCNDFANLVKKIFFSASSSSSEAYPSTECGDHLYYIAGDSRISFILAETYDGIAKRNPPAGITSLLATKVNLRSGEEDLSETARLVICSRNVHIATVHTTYVTQ